MMSKPVWIATCGVMAMGMAAVQPAEAFWNPLEFDEAKVLFEENTTDGDLGFHFKVDGEPWNRVLLVDPMWRVFVNVNVSGRLGGVVLTELFSESAEPSFDEVPRQEFLDRFIEGTYLFIGIGLDNQWSISQAALTKNIPQGPVIVSPMEEETVDSETDLIVEWDPVPDPHSPESLIEFYELVVEVDDDDVLQQVLTVILPADATHFTVPAEYLRPDTDYKVELIAEETSHNRAASEVPFETEDE